MKLSKWLLRLYPASWRSRYEEEFLAMLGEYRSLRLSDVFDVMLGAVDAHIQCRRSDPKRMHNDLLPRGAGSMQIEHHAGSLDKDFAKRLFEEGISKHKLAMEYVDVDYKRYDGDEKEILTLFFKADDRLDLKPICIDLAGVYKQKIRLRQTARISPKKQD
ncbi:hypothetical protein FE784_05335 [Paenibacillus hemerocallicola]|uniref:PSP1 C-terminal domain-containing protein n=1 Tax=Paenibacillus hemerocallicola TaxID=1172614 RepID=A0A5C4TFV3_9BACL|nr:PSP1 C-terminal domain-containing protein [Paenibacillus hemerocallicola]TNJ67380.1 hypothetical protein FE784_05335 [Paenibacillus hemerocallicola]